MCYSAESSASTFIFVCLVSIYLYRKGDNIHKAVAIILFFISLMQVVEYFIWLNIECTNINKTISYCIPILLFLQPIITAGAVLYFRVGFLPPIVYKSILGIWIFSLPFFIDWMRDGFGKCTTVGPKGRLVWPYANSSIPFHQTIQSLYNSVLGVSIATLNTEWFGGFYVITAYFAYIFTKQTYGHSWGSVWCNFVNILATGALFI